MGIYIQNILYSLVIFISNVRGGGNIFLHFMLFPTFLEKNNSGNKFFFFRKNISFSFHVFFMLDLFPKLKKKGNIEKCPFTYWLNGRWFLQIVDIGNFNMKLNGRWFPQIVDRDSGNLYPIYIKQKLWC